MSLAQIEAQGLPKPCWGSFSHALRSIGATKLSLGISMSEWCNTGRKVDRCHRVQEPGFIISHSYLYIILYIIKPTKKGLVL